MEREQLTRVIEEPGRIVREDLVGLRDLTERYPWFSGAQMLRAMGEQALGEVLHEETLRNSAAHVPDRAPLYNAAHRPAPEERTKTAASDTERREVASVALVSTVPLTKLERPALPMGPGEPISLPDAAVPAQPALDSAELTIAPTEAANMARTPEPAALEVEPSLPPPTADVLDAEIRRAALATSFELLMEYGEPPEVERPAPESVDLGDTKASSGLTPANEPATEPEEIVALATPLRAGRRSFTSWLNEVEVAPPAPRPIIKAEQAQTTAIPIQADTEIPTVKPLEPALPTSELIDRFIQQSSPEPKPKAEFFTPQQAGKRSLDDTAGLVTETLAIIYEKQGNFPKAAETYRKLALKYPDKSTYFAARQKELHGRSTK